MTRRLALLLAATLAGAGVLGAPAAAQAAAPAWTHGGYGPGNTGYNATESVINAGTVKNLRLTWRVRPAAGTEGCQDRTTPVVAGGRMFVVDGDGVGAYHLTTGKRLWRDTTVMPDRVHRTMTVAGGLVVTTGYNCYSNSDPSGHITALDAVTGKVRWHVLEGSATERVVADAGMLVSYSMCGICSSDRVAGYRATDGALRWSHEAILASSVSAAGRLLLTGQDAGSFAVAATTGKVLWTSAVRWSALAADPAGRTFYVAGPTGALAALDAATGKVRWSVAAAVGPLAADGRRVYVSRGSAVTAYDAVTGKKLWGRAGFPAGRPIRAGGLLYAPGNVLSPVTGKLVVKATYSSADQHVVVVGGRVLRVKGTEVQAYAP